MEISDSHVVVTGAAHGIGRALVDRFATEGARGLVVADRDLATAAEV
ncbi:MAG: SDR family NAD(P)-dependent oxidoreductase, partial [Acidimicrobiia bacterium]